MLLPLPSPEEPQTHLLLGKFLGSLHAIIMALGLQVDIQQHTQALQLVGQELMARPRATQLLVAYIDFTLHGLQLGKPETQHDFQTAGSDGSTRTAAGPLQELGNTISGWTELS